MPSTIFYVTMPKQLVQKLNPLKVLQKFLEVIVVFILANDKTKPKPSSFTSEPSNQTLNSNLPQKLISVDLLQVCSSFLFLTILILCNCQPVSLSVTYVLFMSYNILNTHGIS